MPISKQEFQEKLDKVLNDPDYRAVQSESNLAYEIAIENGILMGLVFTPDREQEWQTRRKAVFSKHGL